MAAIQVLGAHVWDSRPVEHWVGVLGQEPQSVESKQWEDVFDKHPEFFGKELWSRKKEEEGIEVFTYYLRWRRAYERTIDPDSLEEISNEEIATLKTEGKYYERKLSRKTLTPEQIGTLLNAAIELQDRAIGFEARSRWWLPIIIPVITALLGLLGVIVGVMLNANK